MTAVDETDVYVLLRNGRCPKGVSAVPVVEG
jgi:hypothetical protein